MNIQSIDIGFSKIKKIVHFSDVHCRLFNRHTEYRKVFDQFYKEIEKTPKETLILNLGDTHHSKIDMSHEAVDIITDFLKNLADLRPTCVITGNHDLNLSNSNRLDALSPLIKALDHKNLFYLKDSGVYRLGDALFTVMSVLDEPETYIMANEIPSRCRDQVNHTIALYHGTIDKVKTSLGFEIKNPRMTTEKFKEYDIAMLGDIHLHSVVQEHNKKEKKPIIVYNGSLIAQDHSECDDMHGFCLWDMDKRSFEFVKLQNDYGFFTIDVHDGKLITDLSQCPSKAKLRVRSFNSVSSEVNEIVSEIKKKFNLSEVQCIKCEDEETKRLNKTLNENKLHELNVSNVDFQNDLICRYLQGKYNETELTSDIIESIKRINVEINNCIPKEESIRNVNWKLKTLEFDNVFCYGEGNKIDFTKLNDIVGLFSKNASGKSSLLSVLCYVLFDKCERAYKGNHIMNDQKTSFMCRVNFQIGDVDYWIERLGTKDKKGSVKVKVNFWKMENGQKVSLNDDERRGTNSVIRDYIGTIEDFSLTSLALQGKDISFIELGQAEKKDLFTRFMGINIFESLFSKATERYKETSVLLKNFNKEDYTDTVSKLENRILELTEHDTTYTSEHEVFLQNRENINNDILNESKKLIKLNNVSTDIDGLLKSKELLEKSIKTSEVELKTIENDLLVLLNSGKEVKSKINTFENDNVKDKKLEYDQCVKESTSLHHQYEMAQVRLTQQNKKLETLSKHKYDPNCKFCIDNEFVKDAHKTKQDIENEKPNIEKLNLSIKEIDTKVENLKGIVAEYREYEKLVNSFADLKENVNEKTRNKLRHQSNINDQTNRLNKTSEEIELYKKCKDDIEKNKNTEYTISVYKTKLASVDSTIKQSNQKIRDNNSSLVSTKDELTKIKDNISKMKVLEEQHKSFEYYLEAINRDGIPYELISQSLPTIENEVNNILSQIVKFTIEMKADSKNIIINRVEGDRRWPLELCSGMEKFCSALSIRVALMNVCSIPKSNFLGIDEGFVSCDADHMAMAHSLLSFLKTNFDFVMIITHTDTMKDVVNSHLEIGVEGMFSKINNT